MSERNADLHIHTYFSDSTMSPEEVVLAAKACNLAAIAIADHDTIDGIAPARIAAEPFGIEVVPAVELSSDDWGRDVHILAYMFDLNDSPLVRLLKEIRQVRVERMRKMVAKLSGFGITDITFEQVCEQTKSEAVGRLHLARLLLARKHVRSIDEAFRKYLAEDAPLYVPKFKQTTTQAIKLIKDSGGLAVLAHPMLTRVDEKIPGLVKAGLDGLEAYYPNTPMDIVNGYVAMAEKYDLLVTGGSDAHGEVKTSTYIGKAYVPYGNVLKMKACKVGRVQSKTIEGGGMNKNVLAILKLGTIIMMLVLSSIAFLYIFNLVPAAHIKKLILKAMIIVGIVVVNFLVIIFLSGQKARDE